MLKDNPIFKIKKKKLKQSFFLPKNFAQTWVATKKWSFERSGVKNKLDQIVFLLLYSKLIEIDGVKQKLIYGM